MKELREATEVPQPHKIRFAPLLSLSFFLLFGVSIVFLPALCAADS